MKNIKPSALSCVFQFEHSGAIGSGFLEAAHVLASIPGADIMGDLETQIDGGEFLLRAQTFLSSRQKLSWKDVLADHGIPVAIPQDFSRLVQLMGAPFVKVPEGLFLSLDLVDADQTTEDASCRGYIEVYAPKGMLDQSRDERISAFLDVVEQLWLRLGAMSAFGSLVGGDLFTLQAAVATKIVPPPSSFLDYLHELLIVPPGSDVFLRALSRLESLPPDVSRFLPDGSLMISFLHHSLSSQEVLWPDLCGLLGLRNARGIRLPSSSR